MPSTTTYFNTNVFRLYCTLTENVDKKLLQEALDKALIEFPLFLYTMKNGLFWHYLETNYKTPIIQEEKEYPCKYINPNLKDMCKDKQNDKETDIEISADEATIDTSL